MEVNDLRLLGHEDERIAKPAFDRAWAGIRGKLVGHLRTCGCTESESEDLAQTVSLRLWSSRASLEVAGPGAWWRLSTKIAKNASIDLARMRKGETVEAFDLDLVPDADASVFDVILEKMGDLDQIWDAADRLWLGSPTSVGDSPPDKSALSQRTLAAQLFFLHDAPIPDILRLVNASGRLELETWLKDPATLRHVAFNELYWTNDRLASHILDPLDARTSDQLDQLLEKAHSGEGNPPAGWSWDEILVLFWRIRNGLLSGQILRFERCTLDAAKLEHLLERFRSGYPFIGLAKRLVSSFTRARSQKVLSETGLWRRLVFEYHAKCELPYKQIFERTGPPAEVAGAQLTEPMLTGWIGLGRLWTQLAASLEGGSN